MNPIIVPFAGVLGTESGESSNGAVHSKLARVNVPSVLSSVMSSSGSKIYHGDADSSGNITYHNMTTAANNDTASDVEIFNSVNPTKDVLCVELISGDDIQSIDLFLGTAGVYTGTAQPKAWYKSSAGIHDIRMGTLSGSTATYVNIVWEIIPSITQTESSFTVSTFTIPTYANNAAAIAGSAAIGSVYHNGADPDLICVVH